VADSSAPMVVITAQQMFEMMTRMEKVTNDLVSGLHTLKEVADDHEDRLRIVEQRADTEKRLEAIELRVTQHDAAFTKQGERLGVMETEVRGLKDRWAGRTKPVVVASVVAAFLTIIVDAILHFV
jgi:hypothetical protein